MKKRVSHEKQMFFLVSHSQNRSELECGQLPGPTDLSSQGNEDSVLCKEVVSRLGKVCHQVTSVQRCKTSLLRSPID